MNLFEQRRRKLGKTRSQMAEELCVSRVTVNNWETNKSFPRRRIIKRVARVYGLTPEQVAKQSLSAGTLK